MVSFGVGVRVGGCVVAETGNVGWRVVGSGVADWQAVNSNIPRNTAIENV